MNARTETHGARVAPGAAPLWRWVALATVFAVGAWQGYGFGTRIAGPMAGPWLGVLTGLNMGAMAAVAAATLGQSLGPWLVAWRRS